MNALPKGWRRDRLKDIAAINATSLPSNTDPDFEFGYLEISNVDYQGIVDLDVIERLRYEDAPSRARRKVTNGSTLISSVRPNLQAVAHVSEAFDNLICSTGFNVVDPHQKYLVPKFAYYSLIAERARQHLEAVAIGVGYPAVSDKEFCVFPVLFPESSEQKRIVAYLDATSFILDAAIAAKREQIETLDRVRQATLQRIITGGLEAKPRLTSTGNHWLSRVPVGWTLVMLKRVANIQGGLTLGKVYDGPLVERPYLRVANVQDGHLDLDDITMIEVPAEIAERVTLQVGDVLMTEGGDLDKLGRGHVWDGEIADCLHQNHVFAVRCVEWKLRPKFLAYVTASQLGRDYFEATGKRTTNLAATNSTKVGQLPIPLPPLDVQDKIIAHLDDVTEKSKALRSGLQEQITTLIAYRKSLIHECVTGQRRITEADLARVHSHA